MINFSLNSTEFFKLKNNILGNQPTIQSSIVNENGEQVINSGALLKKCKKMNAAHISAEVLQDHS